MKKIIGISVVLLVLIALIVPNILQSKDGDYKNIIKRVVYDLGKNTMMDYESTFTMKDYTKSLKGRIAHNESGNMYDSSNSRLLLYNNDWMLNIDHENKMVDALYLPKVKTQLPDSSMLDFKNNIMSSFGNLTAGEMDFQREASSGGQYWLRSKSRENADDVYEVELLFNKDDKLLEYKGTAQIPMNYEVKIDSSKSGYEQVPTEIGTLSFRCYNIDTLQADIFDEARLIEFKGKGAYLKRYKKYKMFKN